MLFVGCKQDTGLLTDATNLRPASEISWLKEVYDYKMNSGELWRNYHWVIPTVKCVHLRAILKTDIYSDYDINK